MRGVLPELSFSLFRNPSTEDRLHLQVFAELLEKLHAGSLIIDDIEDLSSVRRGGPTLHLKYGLNTALNSGCYLYFDAFSSLRLSSIESAQKVLAYEAALEVLQEAHLGQSLDLHVNLMNLNAQELKEICAQSILLKSGALMGLGMELGAILAGASEQQKAVFKKFGRELGVALQKFDDLGNFNCATPTEKHLEDLMLQRPSFLWIWAAENDVLDEFRHALQALPDPSALSEWEKKHHVQARAWAQARVEFDQHFGAFEQEITNWGLASQQAAALYDLGERIAHAYR